MIISFKVCNANKSVGEEISRLKCAIELFKVAQSKSGDSSMFSEEISRAQRACDEAVKDNDFIYHERVPDVRYLCVKIEKNYIFQSMKLEISFFGEKELSFK